MSKQKNILRLILDLMLAGGTVLMVAATFLLVGPAFESTFLPVTKDVKVYEVPSASPDRVALNIIGDKVRECRFIEASALSGTEELPEKAEIFYVPRTGSTRPTGRQSFGVWEFYPTGNYVKVQVVHECHALWPTVTTFFEWRKP